MPTKRRTSQRAADVACVLVFALKGRIGLLLLSRAANLDFADEARKQALATVSEPAAAKAATTVVHVAADAPAAHVYATCPSTTGNTILCCLVHESDGCRIATLVLSARAGPHLLLGLQDGNTAIRSLLLP